MYIKSGKSDDKVSVGVMLRESAILVGVLIKILGDQRLYVELFACIHSMTKD